MQVGVKVNQAAKGLDGDDPAGGGVGSEEGLVDFADGLPREGWEALEHVAMEVEEGAETFGDGPDELAMGNESADLVGEMEAKKEGAFLGATGADAALLAGEGDEEFVPAIGATDAGEAVVEVAALEELVDGLVDDGSPITKLAGITFGIDGAEVIEVLADEAMEVGFQRLTGAVDGGGSVGGGAGVGEAGHDGPRMGDRAASLRKG
jgi:hypothetical protein